MVDRREFLKRAGAGVAVAGAVAAFPQGVWAGITKTSARKPLRVGNLLTLSGPSSAPSVDIKRGFATYVKSRNGLGGRKIQFIDADDANNPATAIQQVQKLVGEQGVDVIEGIFFSSILLGVRDTIDQLKVPTVVANAAANAISRDRKSDYIWRTSYSNHQLGVPLGPWAANRIGKSGVAVISANYAAGQESAQAFQQAYEKAGGNLAGGIIYTPFPVTPDYQPYFQQAADRGAKGVWAFTPGGGEAIKFVKTYKQFGFDKQFQLFGSNNMTDPQSVLDAEGDAAIGIRTTANWAPTLKNKENLLFLKQYDKFGGRRAVRVRRVGLRGGAVPRSRPAEGRRRHEQQAALPQGDGERRHLAGAGRQADDGPEDAQRDRACLPAHRRQVGVDLQAAVGLDDRDLQGARRLAFRNERRPVPTNGRRFRIDHDER